MMGSNPLEGRYIRSLCLLSSVLVVASDTSCSVESVVCGVVCGVCVCVCLIPCDR